MLASIKNIDEFCRLQNKSIVVKNKPRLIKSKRNGFIVKFGRER